MKQVSGECRYSCIEARTPLGGGGGGDPSPDGNTMRERRLRVSTFKMREPSFA